MGSEEKSKIFSVVFDKYLETGNYDVQEVSLWVLNILAKDANIRKNITYLHLIETKKCGWMGLPKVDMLPHRKKDREKIIKDRIS